MTHPRSRRWQAAGPVASRLAGAALLGCAVLGAAAPGVFAQPGAPALAITGPWLRFILASRPAAGYFVLRNDTDRAFTLVGAASPDCGTMMLHQSVQRDGQDEMVMVQAIPLPAKGKLAFAPGGYHLMCMSPAPSLRPGKTVPVTLNFADGSKVTADFPVHGATGP